MASHDPQNKACISPTRPTGSHVIRAQVNSILISPSSLPGIIVILSLEFRLDVTAPMKSSLPARQV